MIHHEISIEITAAICEMFPQPEASFIFNIPSYDLPH